MSRIALNLLMCPNQPRHLESRHLACPWIDMTTDELLTSDNFTFYKALTSVELGDPRTDAGCSQLLPENECSISLEDALSVCFPIQHKG